MNIIVGTAGHIDHGKTSLVKALTGVDTDRLPEEQKRGVTIDLGFADLDLGDVHIGFVDVPGHERFVKNMLAGAHGIDIVALVVAADEGVMPQTREHFAICRLLETKAGIVVLTKTDLIDDELLELVTMDVAELVKGSFLENAPIVPVSARSGEGLDHLKTTLAEIARSLPDRTSRTITRLPIDRSFSIKGFGAVVTGTLISGEIKEGAEMELLPVHRKVRVRGIQTHGKTTSSAFPGQRTAVNLGGVDHSEIERGLVLAESGRLRPSQIIDVRLETLNDAPRPLKSRQRVRLHLGTVEVLARIDIVSTSNEVLPGEAGYAQLRLEAPIAAVPGDRFILRSYSPQVTIAGGVILDCQAQKYRRKEMGTTLSRLERLSRALKQADRNEQLNVFIECAGEKGASLADLAARTGWPDISLSETLESLSDQKAVIDADGFFLSSENFERLLEKTTSAIEAFHKGEPLARGMMRETLREKLFAGSPPEVFRKAIATLTESRLIEADKDVVRLASKTRQLSPADAAIHQKLSSIYALAVLEVPTLDTALLESVKGTSAPIAHARKIFQMLIESGEVVKVTEEFYFAATAMDSLREKLSAFANGSPDRLIDVPKFKEIAGISRKYAIPLLEYFDREKITRRAGDKRLIL